MNIILAQIIGLIGLVCSSLAVNQGKKDKILAFQLLANALYFFEYLLLDATSAGLICFLAVFRCFTFYKLDQNDKRSVSALVIFEVLALIIGIFTYNGLISLLPIIIFILYTYATWQNNLKLFRIVAFIVPICWVIYNLRVLAYVSAISSFIEMISAIIAIYRFDIKKKGVSYEERKD